MITTTELINELDRLFAIEDFDNAEALLNTARNLPTLYNDIIAIYDANLSLYKENYTQMWQAIKRGLSCNYQNYELYVLLGEYYLTQNPNQAFLCFENALFYCDKKDDLVQIQTMIEQLKQEHTITVNNVSFIILSYNLLDDTINCIESIRGTVPASAREIVIVDNASTDGSVEWLKEQDDIILLCNTENSGFPKGCNQGVAIASPQNDIFLLNNDVLLPPNALFWLRMGLYENDSVGTTGSITNNAGNLQALPFTDNSTSNLMNFAINNNLPQEYPYEEKLYLIGFALLIKRSVYNLVGDLDERFSPGNYEDNDYGIRVLNAGYKNVLCKNSFIIHFGSKSFNKNKSNYQNLLTSNARKFEEKWNLSPLYYFKPHPELFSLIEVPKETPLRILDIGCGCGALLAHMKGVYPNAQTYGIELDDNAAKYASLFGDVICGDVESSDLSWPHNFFDYVIMGNVLEHLREPSIVLKKIYPHLKERGRIIASMPNVKHYSVMIPLIKQDVFPYSDAGILDTTHVKMYTKMEMAKLLYQAGFTLLDAIYTTVGTPTDEDNKIIDILVELSESKDRTEYLAYQNIMLAEKTYGNR